MKKIPVANRILAALMALVLVAACVLNVSAGTVFTGDSSTGKVIVKLSSGGGGTIVYNIDGTEKSTAGSIVSRGIPVGTVCTATAEDTEALPFMYWINEFGDRICSYEPTITFIAGSRAFYTAIFNTAESSQRFVQFVNYGGNTLLKNYVVDKGTTIKKPANPVTAGFTFLGWSSSIDEVNASDENMVVTPRYQVKKETYTVSITNDAYVSGAGEYPNYSTVNLKAKEKNGAGETFSYWKNSDGKIVSYDRNYSFRINYNTTLTAVYGETVTPEPIIRVSTVYRDTANYQLTVFAERSVPEEYTVVSHGLLMSTSTTVTDASMTVASGAELDNSVIRKVYGNSTERCGTFSLAKSAVADSTEVIARPFLIYQDAAGKEYLAYGDVVRATNAG